MKCTVGDCANEYYQDGFCNIHWWRNRWLDNTDKNDLGIVSFLYELFPEAFSKRFGLADYHKEMLYQLLYYGSYGKNVFDRMHAFEVFRGGAKSTVITFGYSMYNVLYKLKHNILLIGESNERMVEHLETIKHELEENEFVKTYFGIIKAHKTLDQKGKWTEDEVVTSTGIKIKARGVRQGIRGAKFHHFRVDLLIAEDLETEANSNTPELRKKNVKWYNRAALPTVDIENGEIVHVGTPIAEDTILDTAMKGGLYHCIKVPIISKYPAIQEEIDSGIVVLAWKTKLPLRIINQIYETAKENNDIDGFWQEQMLEIKGSETQKFKQEYYKTIKSFRLFKEFGETWLTVEFPDGKSECLNGNVFVACDPASHLKDENDDTAIVPIFRDYHNRIFVLPIRAGKFGFRDTPRPEYIGHLDDNKVEKDYTRVLRPGSVDEVLRVSFNNYATSLIWETVSAQIWGYMQAISLRNKNSEFTFSIIEEKIEDGRNKERRITDILIGAFESYKVYFVDDEESKRCYHELVYLGYINHDDRADALSMAVKHSYSPSASLQHETLYMTNLLRPKVKSSTDFLLYK